MAAGPPPVLEIEPLDAPPDAVVRLPGSKSITNRAVLCAALAEGETRIEGALFADDTEAMFAALRALGADLDLDPAGSAATVRGAGGLPDPGRTAGSGGAVAVDARMSGTTSRFLAPVAAAGGRPVVIDGHPQLRNRPFGDLVDGLRGLGVQVEAPAGPGRLPLRIAGPMRRHETAVAADRSSQFLSGLMLAAPLTDAGLTLRLTSEAVSRPYVEMTAAVMEAFGAAVETAPDRIRVAGGGYRSPGRYRIGAVVSELRRCGVDAVEGPDGFTVSPRQAPAGALIRTYDDHRLAMAFSVLGLVAGGMRIENPGCVAKTFPGFYKALDSLRAGGR